VQGKKSWKGSSGLKDGKNASRRRRASTVRSKKKKKQLWRRNMAQDDSSSIKGVPISQISSRNFTKRERRERR